MVLVAFGFLYLFPQRHVAKRPRKSLNPALHLKMQYFLSLGEPLLVMGIVNDKQLIAPAHRATGEN